ncbi:hypothetical protein PCASD_05788 [Puccinia coronata f. sp. avenae]|uniref:Uncharacterized protein n=1 Tax=Puccinia coronata f. sp. avenae TaxID=200324 RepID=A0A2N5V1Q7_9BASI|nr:hypothetical protein PCASD_05788 [Puccinia coronata f. sp. avenae]
MKQLQAMTKIERAVWASNSTSVLRITNNRYESRKCKFFRELAENIDKSVESFNCFENRQESNQEDKDPESQTKHTNPALDPDLLDYNPQNQQRPTTSPKNKLQQSTQRKRKGNTWYRQRRDELTAETRALDSSSSNHSLSSEVIVPTNSPKKKNKKKKANANKLPTRPSPA